MKNQELSDKNKQELGELHVLPLQVAVAMNKRGLMDDAQLMVMCVATRDQLEQLGIELKPKEH